MRFVGFNFTKISVEKKSDNFKDLKITTNIDVSEIKPVKNEILKQKEELVGIKFKFSVEYKKDVAEIELDGNILAAIDPKEAKELMKQWKDKKMPEDFRIPLFNVIIRKSSIKALELEDEMNLPLHVPLPTIRKE